jgi:serine/threonine protein phosphatase PrpC
MSDSGKIDIGQLPEAVSNGRGIDFVGRIGNVPLQIRETIGRRDEQEDQIFTALTPVENKDQACKLLEMAFEEADKKTRDNREGSIGTVTIISKDHFLNIAHVGDSPVVLFVVGADNKVTAHPLIKPHKPDDPAEKARIEHAGGTVSYPGRTARVNGVLNMSRAFGDQGLPVSKIPDITTVDLSKFVQPGEKAYLCVSCDGLYEGDIPENHFAKIIGQALERGQKNKIANFMKNYAFSKWSGDNISVILAEIPESLNSSIALGVCDGHGGKLTAQQAANTLEGLIKEGKIPAQFVAKVPIVPLKIGAPTESPVSKVRIEPALPTKEFPAKAMDTTKETAATGPAESWVDKNTNPVPSDPVPYAAYWKKRDDGGWVIQRSNLDESKIRDFLQQHEIAYAPVNIKVKGTDDELIVLKKLIVPPEFSEQFSRLLENSGPQPGRG